MEEGYSATKTRSGRPGWSVIFRHPLRRDARGKPGLKIRRGLNTTDDGQADEYVAQLNRLLSDRRKRMRADKTTVRYRTFLYAETLLFAREDSLRIKQSPFAKAANRLTARNLSCVS